MEEIWFRFRNNWIEILIGVRKYANFLVIISISDLINSWMECYTFYGNFNVELQTWRGNVIKLWYFAQNFSNIDLDSRAQNYVPLGVLNATHAQNNTIVLIAMSNIYLVCDTHIS